jgi:hypothetical protein
MGFFKQKTVEPFRAAKNATPETTQPGDEGKKSKRKNRGSTILTSVTGINQPATLSSKSLLG